MWQSSSAKPMTPRPDLAGGAGGLAQFGEGVAADIDDVVEESHRHSGNLVEPVPVDSTIRDHPREVDRAEVARFVGQKRDLSARVGRLDPASPRHRVGPD